MRTAGSANAARDQRTELQTGLKGLNDTLRTGTQQINDAFAVLARGSAEASDKLRDALTTSVKLLQEGNEKKLEGMRATALKRGLADSRRCQDGVWQVRSGDYQGEEAALQA